MQQILAQAPTVGLGTYLSLVKIVVVAALYIGWLFAVQWMDRDVTRINKAKREWWNLLVLAGGYGGLAALVLVPWSGAAFLVGLAFWVIAAGGTMTAYVVHRNAKVGPAMRVMTPAHFKRLAGGEGGKKAKIDKGVRVKLIGADGKEVQKPDEVLELDRFNATQDFLFDVLWRRATDIDMLVGETDARLIYKIDGVPSEQSNELSRDDAERVLSYLKNLAGLDAEEKRRPQTGTIRVALLGSTGKPAPLDVTSSGSTKGERLKLRHHPAVSLKRFEDLGFAEDLAEKYKVLVAQETGLVLFAGPKESGITTTEYATLRGHDAYMQNIYTLENEMLLKLDNISQTSRKSVESEVSYARQLQTVLRREPDVVLVDQCEDRETAQLACRAAVDKKIYLTIRAANAVDGLSRLLALVEDPKLVAQSLIGVVGQRLLRVLCEACREAYKPDDALLHKANLPADDIEFFYRPPSAPIVDKKGREITCQNCQNSRYVGRIGVFELLIVSDKIRQLIASGASASQIKGQARTEKMRSLQEDGLRKVIAGTTSMAEVMRGLRTNGK